MCVIYGSESKVLSEPQNLHLLQSSLHYLCGYRKSSILHSHEELLMEAWAMEEGWGKRALTDQANQHYIMGKKE